MGRNVNFVDKFTNQESVLHMGRNAISAKRTIIGKLLCDKESIYMKHLPSLMMIL